MQTLVKNIEHLVGNNPEYLDEVLCRFVKVQLKKGQWVLREGKVCNDVFFVTSGILQVVQTDKSGYEKTIDLILKDSWFTDFASFRGSVPSGIGVIAYRRTMVYKLSRPSFEKLLETVPKFAMAYMKILEAKYRESYDRNAMLSFMSSEERIDWLSENRAEFPNEVPDTLIASYLGISKETYCRKKGARFVAKYQ
jgi:CRP-like cAMP-binding protein